MEKFETPAWKRLKYVITNSNEKSINEFARKIGLKRAENLYQIKRGYNQISRKLATMINEIYPQYSISWLLAGDAHREGGSRLNEIPFFEYFNNDNSRPSDIFYLSPSIGCDADIATISKDNALSPYVLRGSIVLLQMTSEVIYGDIYLIETCNYRVLRYIRKGKNDKHYRLTTNQPDSYDDMEIEISSIETLYKVCATIYRFTF